MRSSAHRICVCRSSMRSIIRSADRSRATDWICLQLGQLTFERPDTETFRGLALAYQAMRSGGNIPTAFNAANEKAVALFLDRKIAYQQIPEMIESCMEAADFIANPTVDEILETEAAAYEHIAGKWGKVFA